MYKIVSVEKVVRHDFILFVKIFCREHGSSSLPSPVIDTKNDPDERVAYDEGGGRWCNDDRCDYNVMEMVDGGSWS